LLTILKNRALSHYPEVFESATKPELITINPFTTDTLPNCLAISITMKTLSTLLIPDCGKACVHGYDVVKEG